MKMGGNYITKQHEMMRTELTEVHLEEMHPKLKHNASKWTQKEQMLKDKEQQMTQKMKLLHREGFGASKAGNELKLKYLRLEKAKWRNLKLFQSEKTEFVAF
eukprot:929113_1